MKPGTQETRTATKHDQPEGLADISRGATPPEPTNKPRHPGRGAGKNQYPQRIENEFQNSAIGPDAYFVMSRRMQMRPETFPRLSRHGIRAVTPQRILPLGSRCFSSRSRIAMPVLITT